MSHTTFIDQGPCSSSSSRLSSSTNRTRNRRHSDCRRAYVNIRASGTSPLDAWYVLLPPESHLISYDIWSCFDPRVCMQRPSHPLRLAAIPCHAVPDSVPAFPWVAKCAQLHRPSTPRTCSGCWKRCGYQGILGSLLLIDARLGNGGVCNPGHRSHRTSKLAFNGWSGSNTSTSLSLDDGKVTWTLLDDCQPCVVDESW